MNLQGIMINIVTEVTIFPMSIIDLNKKLQNNYYPFEAHEPFQHNLHIIFCEKAPFRANNNVPYQNVNIFSTYRDLFCVICDI